MAEEGPESFTRIDPRTTAPRRLVAIMIADIVDYSRLTQRDERGTHYRVERLRHDVIVPTVLQHNGTLRKQRGDGFLCTFDSPVECVRCAIIIQQSMFGDNLERPEADWIRFRIGINIGDVIIASDDIYGDGVNVAARLEALAPPSGIYISGSVYEHVKFKLVCGYQSLGDRQLKNIQEPVPIYRVLPDPSSVAAATKPNWLRVGAIAAGVAMIFFMLGGAWFYSQRETEPKLTVAQAPAPPAPRAALPQQPAPPPAPIPASPPAAAAQPQQPKTIDPSPPPPALKVETRKEVEPIFPPPDQPQRDATIPPPPPAIEAAQQPQTPQMPDRQPQTPQMPDRPAQAPQKQDRPPQTPQMPAREPQTPQTPQTPQQQAMLIPKPPSEPHGIIPAVVHIKDGSFEMGSNEDPSEEPIHKVAVRAFVIGRSPVTVREWRQCVDAQACSYVPHGNDDQPLSNVSWNDTQQYLAWLSKATNRQWRLPTEAEWEYAARGGTHTRFWWGDAMKAGMAICKGCGDKLQQGAANPFGLVLNDGVAEWVQDCWVKDYKGAPADGSARSTPGCSERVLRGAAPNNDSSYARPASRDYYDASVRYPTHGFRVAASE
jgi:formylglycine-generating enzyme required for sulfatase activity/class 3 adenylate cyclase